MSAAAEASLASLLDAAATVHGGRPAVLHHGSRTTWAELATRAHGAADALAAQGVRPGDCIGLLLPNGVDWIAAFYGILRLGATVVPLNTLLADREIEQRVTDAGAALVVREPLRGDGSRPSAPASGTDVAVLLYTSGTTGRPKGVELTHAGLATVARSLVEALGIREDDVLLGAAPLAHVFGMCGVMNAAVISGAAIAFLDRFTAAAALDLIEAEHVSVVLGVPTMLGALLEESRATGRAPAIRLTHCGGAPLAPGVLARFTERFSCAVLEGYGLTETAGTVTTHRAGAAVKPGTVGPAVPGVEIRLADGDPGEVLVRGPGVMRGYRDRPDETAAVLSPDGWLATGDIGTIDADGYLTLVDRKKDVVLRGGYTVYPRVVEDALLEHPAVVSAVAVGVPDERLGEEVAAVVVVCEPVEPTELVAFARERVAAYAYPRLVHVADTLPVGATGKVLRREIDRDELRRLLDAQTRSRPT